MGIGRGYHLGHWIPVAHARRPNPWPAHRDCQARAAHLDRGYYTDEPDPAAPDTGAAGGAYPRPVWHHHPRGAYHSGPDAPDVGMVAGAGHWRRGGWNRIDRGR